MGKNKSAKSENHFDTQLESVKDGVVPDQDRACNDICCLITFIILILGTLALGIVSLVEGKAAF